jgi:septal ring factor EnvC (AmiA/AmiB activator)
VIRSLAAVCIVALLLPAPALGAPAAAEELKALRARLEKLKLDIARSEDSRSEATDALKDSEVAISDAGRRLAELAESRQEVEARLAAIGEEEKAVEARLDAQRRLAARLVYQHYTNQGSPGLFEILAAGTDLNALARDGVYLQYVAQARTEVLVRLLAESNRLLGLEY